MTNKILFAKTRADAKIPYKREDDAGFDLYASFDETYMLIKPNETKLIPSGLKCAFSSDYVMILKERGSTGTKGMGQRAGVVDASFRGEIFIPITNHGLKPIIIPRDMTDSELIALSDDYLIYPYSKAICQAIMVPVPKFVVEEVAEDVIDSMTTERGSGALGSSGK